MLSVPIFLLVELKFGRNSLPTDLRNSDTLSIFKKGIIVLDIIKFIIFLNIIKGLDITVRRMFIGFRSSNINNPKWLDIQRNLI
jgi:hypothetical protein